jgi:hypothetical protein
MGNATIARPRAPVCQGSLAPDQEEVALGLCDPEAIAVLAAVVWEVADRGSATEEIQTRLQDDFAAISRQSLIQRLKELDRRHNTANPVGG